MFSFSNLVIYIEQRQMITTDLKEVLPRSISVNYFILWTVEYGIIYRQHSGNSENFL